MIFTTFGNFIAGVIEGLHTKNVVFLFFSGQMKRNALKRKNGEKMRGMRETRDGGNCLFFSFLWICMGSGSKIFYDPRRWREIEKALFRGRFSFRGVAIAYARFCRTLRVRRANVGTSTLDFPGMSQVGRAISWVGVFLIYSFNVSFFFIFRFPSDFV